MAYLTRCDDNHVGHFFFNIMRNRPDDVCQIDAATGDQRTRRFVLSQSIRLAQCFRNVGLQPGDVLMLGGTNYLDLIIPFSAALMSGLPMAGVDPQFKFNELVFLFKIVEPKIAFCESEMYDVYRQAVLHLGLGTKIVTFGSGDSGMDNFMQTYDDQKPEEEFTVATFDTEKVYCWLLSTSGTTGFPRVVALTHSHILSYFKGSGVVYKSNMREGRLALILSPIQFVSSTYNVLSMLIDHVMLLTTAPATTKHVIDIINKYKPAVILTTNASVLAAILRHKKHCDLTCFNVISLGGNKIHKEFLWALKDSMHKNAKLLLLYGQTENGGIVLVPEPNGPFGNLGKPRREYQVKIVDPDSGKTIHEPNVTGELWTKGPRMACYYNNPQATAEVFSEDGYYKTGDLFYRDENGFYFFVDRLKMILKYRSYQVSPIEVEEVIMLHEGVADVCVTGVPHPEDGDLVVACVVRKPWWKVTAQEIKDLVASKLSVNKHLYGGVVFMDALPVTSTGKTARAKVKALVLTATRE